MSELPGGKTSRRHFLETALGLAAGLSLPSSTVFKANYTSKQFAVRRNNQQLDQIVNEAGIFLSSAETKLKKIHEMSCKRAPEGTTITERTINNGYVFKLNGEEVNLNSFRNETPDGFSIKLNGSRSSVPLEAIDILEDAFQDFISQA